LIYRDGLGKAQTPEAARYLFESAASQKHGPAYLPTGKLYLEAPVDPNTGKLTAHDLAKAYLWLSAAARQAKDPKDRARVKDLLAKVNQIMPTSWKPELDAKVDAHFAVKP